MCIGGKKTRVQSSCAGADQNPRALATRFEQRQQNRERAGFVSAAGATASEHERDPDLTYAFTHPLILRTSHESQTAVDFEPG
jgi:hypothetical protein